MRCLTKGFRCVTAGCIWLLAISSLIRESRKVVEFLFSSDVFHDVVVWKNQRWMMTAVDYENVSNEYRHVEEESPPLRATAAQEVPSARKDKSMKKLRAEAASTSTSSSYHPSPSKSSSDTSSTSTSSTNEVSAASLQSVDPADINVEEFRMCRLQNPEPEEGQKPVQMEGVVMPVEYQCAGKPYETFASLLNRVIQEEASTRTALPKDFHNISRWGRRRRILPYSKAGRTLLIMGNSHTRQVVSTLLCQYRDQIVSTPTMLYSMPDHPSYGVLHVELDKNLTIYAATNCPFVYSHHWHTTLETILQQPLSSMDAIVLGRFNSYSESTGTQFYQMMMDYQKEYPQFGGDFEHIPGPTLEEVAAVYSAGPIVYAGMFASYGAGLYRQAQEMVDTLQEETGRTGLTALDGRTYIYKVKKLQQQEISSTEYPVHECSSDERRFVTTCIVNETDTRFKRGHRCMGAKGGHPDLLVWDIVDALHYFFLTSSSSSSSTK